MNTFLVPSLQHLSCTRVVISLFNHLEVERNFQESNYKTIKCQVKDTIPRLTSCARVQEKLEQFIDPLIDELKGCLDFFRRTQHQYDNVRFDVRGSILRCWLSEGTIDREKVARLAVDEFNIHPVSRFIFACTFCFFTEALDAWNALLKIEKAYLKHKLSTSIVKLWIEWLESNPTKNWESFVAWGLGTPLSHRSVSFLNLALQTLSPGERSQHLLNAAIGREVGDDVMRFCISLMTKDEQEQILRESTVQVFSCMLSWPLRTIYFDRKNYLWPHLTEESFPDVLRMIVKKIRNQTTNDVQLLITLKEIWEESPGYLQYAAEYCPLMVKLVQRVLDLDVLLFLKKQKPWTDLFQNTTYFLVSVS